MSSLTEIQTATETLPLVEQEELYRFLGERLHSRLPQIRKARLVLREGDTLLEAPPDAPIMTAENVKKMLEEWP